MTWKITYYQNEVISQNTKTKECIFSIPEILHSPVSPRLRYLCKSMKEAKKLIDKIKREEKHLPA